MSWTPPEGARFCLYHPDVRTEWVQKYSGKTRRSKLWWVERCPECEWNPLLSGSGPGRTSPDITPLNSDDADE